MIDPVGMWHAGKPTRDLPVIDTGDKVIPVRNPEWSHGYSVHDLKFHQLFSSRPSLDVLREDMREDMIGLFKEW